MMNYLHFFYGLGSTIGPYYANFFLSIMNMGYRGIFIGLFVPCLIGFIITLCSSLSVKEEAREVKELPITDTPTLPTTPNELQDEMKKENPESQVEVKENSESQVAP